MKFHNGYWLLKEGYMTFSPTQVYEAKKDLHTLHIFAPTKQIEKKGDTLDGAALTLLISAPRPEIIRVQVFHHRGRQKQGPEFELAFSENQPLQVLSSTRKAGA